MTNSEMLALVPEARTQIRNLLTPKQVTQEKASALVQEETGDPVLPSQKELLELPEPPEQPELPGQLVLADCWSAESQAGCYPS